MRFFSNAALHSIVAPGHVVLGVWRASARAPLAGPRSCGGRGCVAPI